MISKSIVLFSCGCMSAALIVNLASASDLPALGKLLTPAYTAMSLTRFLSFAPRFHIFWPGLIFIGCCMPGIVRSI